VSTRLPQSYDCGNCPAYCCTYPQTPVTPTDIARLAHHHGVDLPAATRKFTKRDPRTGDRVLRQRSDNAFHTACRFLDASARECSVYEARPTACRQYPGTPRCGYYDFLSAERSRQGDPELVLAAWVTDV